jgi:2'-hydroxyisoflavone reductase
MELLIIGGTRFLGKALVEAALARGHQVSLFNRGQTNPGWFPEIEKFHGDRNLDLNALNGRSWQAVIDTCAYFPRQVRSLLEALAGRIQHYTFISSISVYADFSQPGLDENASLATIADPAVEEITNDTYGALKALCEQAAETHLPGRSLVLRPGLIVGPFDPSDRFTYWPARVARGGEILAPFPDWNTQVIDVRDLAEWNIRLVEQDVVGIFNATGPAEPLSFRSLLETCQQVSQSQASFTWMEPEFLLNNGVAPWSEIPLWLPGEENAGADQVSIQRALAQGLTFRPIETTVRDTLAWESTRPTGHTWRAGLAPEKEAELLQAWRNLTKS